MAHLNIIQNPRNGCALHGALSAVQAINGAVPVVHANPGCSVINYLAGKDNGNSYGTYQGLSVPSTTAQERHIIFGGASRLREQIKNTVKVVEGDLYVILNSCESAMVGDDVDAMTREIVEQGEPVVDTLAAGFNGGFHYGQEHVLADILKNLPVDDAKKETSDNEKKSINIFGLVPGKDPYLYGNLEELKRILYQAGFETNTFFGFQNGVDELKNASKAAASIVFSRWGEGPAKVLNEKFGVPILFRSSLPLGADNVRSLLIEIGKTVGINDEAIEEIYIKEKAYESFYFEQAIENLVDENYITSVAIVAEEEAAIRYGYFFKEKLGIEIKTIVLTDSLKKDEEHDTNNTAILEALSGNIVITQDKKTIEDNIRKAGADLIIGSSLENEIAEKLDLPLFEIAYPINHRKILNESHIGIKGELTLLEDYIGVAKRFQSARNARLLEKIKENK